MCRASYYAFPQLCSTHSEFSALGAVIIWGLIKLFCKSNLVSLSFLLTAESCRKPQHYFSYVIYSAKLTLSNYSLKNLTILFFNVSTFFSKVLMSRMTKLEILQLYLKKISIGWLARVTRWVSLLTILCTSKINIKLDFDPNCR